MAIGTSDGEYFDDEFSHLTDKLPIILADNKPTPLLRPANDNKNLDLGTGGFDIEKAWEQLRKDMKPPLTLVPK